MRLELRCVKLRFEYEGANGIPAHVDVRVSGELWDEGADRMSLLRMAEIDAEQAVQQLICNTGGI